MRHVTHGKRRNPEAKLQAAIVRFLRATGALVAVTDPGTLRKFGVQGRSTGIPAGWPDLTVVLPGGRFMGIECKSPKGKQTGKQRMMQQQWEQLGHRYILARSVDDVIEALENTNG